MPQPQRLGVLLPFRREAFKGEPTPVAAGDCPQHPGNRLIYCGPCAGERKAADPGARWAMQAEHVRRQCDERFPRRFRNATADHPAILDWIAEVGDQPEDARSLLLLGPTGTGKTYQAYGALRAAAPAMGARNWVATSFPEFVAALKPGGDQEAEMRRDRGADLLLLDDLGTAKATEFVEDSTYRLIDGRYLDMRPSIFTSNIPTDALKASLGDRVASRLAEMCTVVVLDGADRRRKAA